MRLDFLLNTLSVGGRCFTLQWSSLKKNNQRPFMLSPTHTCTHKIHENREIEGPFHFFNSPSCISIDELWQRFDEVSILTKITRIPNIMVGNAIRGKKSASNLQSVPDWPAYLYCHTACSWFLHLHQYLPDSSWPEQTLPPVSRVISIDALPTASTYSPTQSLTQVGIPSALKVATKGLPSINVFSCDQSINH